MKKFPIILTLIIASTMTVSGAVYTLVSASYPINVNGVKQAVQPLNYNGSTYLPLRAISEAVGVPIEWNNTTRSVEITTLDIEALKKACVMIYADDGKTQVQGSGVFIDYDQVLTANHVIENRPNIKTSQGLKLTIEDTNKTLDASVLDSVTEVKPVKIGDSDEVKVGDKVILITSPNGKFNVVTYATIQQSGNAKEFIVTSNDLVGGSSGGAMFNMNGELVGIILSGADKWSFVRPINLIRQAL